MDSTYGAGTGQSLSQHVFHLKIANTPYIGLNFESFAKRGDTTGVSFSLGYPGGSGHNHMLRCRLAHIQDISHPKKENAFATQCTFWGAKAGGFLLLQFLRSF